MTTINEFFLFRPALTAGLVSHLWQSSVVALVILGLLMLSGSLSARTRRALAGLALAKFVLPVAALVSLAGPLAQLFGGGPKIDRLQLPALLLPMPSPLAAGAEAAAAPAAFLVRNFWALAAGLWVGGFALLLGYWALRAWQLRRRLLTDARPLPGPLAQAAGAAAHRMGLATPPSCRSVASGHGPGVLGVLAPVVLLPHGLEETLRPDELEAILIHEFVHVRRRDSWWKFFQMVLVSAFWFNPLVWLLQRRLNLEAEKSCDEEVLAITADPAAYARGIVKAVRFSLGLSQTGFAGAAVPPVTSRLRDILSRAHRPERRLLRRGFLGAGITLLAFSGYAGSIGGEPEAVPAPSAAPAAVLPAVAQFQPPVPAPAMLLPVDPATPVIQAAAPPAVAAVAVKPALPAPVAIQPAGPASLPPAASPVLAVDPANSRARVVVPVEPRKPVALVASVSPPASVAQVYQPRNLDEQPKPTKQLRPVYPIDMKNGGISGQVYIEFMVDSNGRVQNAHVLSSTQRTFENSAVLAVSQWQFKPGRKGGVAVNTLMQVPIVFSLNHGQAVNGAKEVPLVFALDRGGAIPASAPATAAAPAVQAADGTAVFEQRDLDQQPVAIKQPRPHYPFAMMKNRISGEVVVGYLVDPAGKVVSAYVVRSTRPEFESEAVGAVSRWRFKPGKKGGVSVTARMQTPIVFTLMNES